ncbi:TPA: hypothetical protein ACH3X3_010033 [Trebouxia sp. C0006]
MVLLGTSMGFRGDDLMDAKPSLLALTPVVRSLPVPMQPVTCSLRTCKVNSFGWLRYSGFVRHKEPLLDAVGALADLLVFTFNMTGLDVLQKIEAQTLAGNFCYLQPTTSSRVNHGRPHSISCELVAVQTSIQVNLC